VHLFGGIFGRGSYPRFSRVDGRDNRYLEAVFVEVREFIDHGEGVASRWVRSDIGLYPFNQCPLFALDAADHRAPLDLELALIREDRKLLGRQIAAG
jgi:hypothetical protein